jgi:uncharacterized RDD family membrane protein YckC
VFPSGNEVAQPTVPAGVVLAPIVRRVGALILDQIIVALPVVLVVVAIGYTPADTVTSKSLLVFNIAVNAVALVYYTVMIALTGRTVGKIALGTRVVCLVDGGRPGWTEATMRSLVPLSLGAIPRVGVFLGVLVYSIAMWNPLRQGLHDKAAGTLVVLNTTPELPAT